MRQKVRVCAVALSVSLFIFMVIQLIRFNEYAAEATMLQVKRSIKMASVHDLYKLGAICNSVQSYKCSSHVFQEILAHEPASTVALANYAMALSALKKYVRSEPYFKAYFASGGQGLDVQVSYARALKSMGRVHESLPWYYRAIVKNSKEKDLVVELLDVLKSLGRNYEALSLARALNYNDTEILTANYVERKIAADDVRPQRLNLPSVDGRHFYLPIQSLESQKVDFIEATEDERISVLSENDVKKFQLKTQIISHDRHLVAQMKIGHFALSNFEVEICDSCKSIIGSKTLNMLSARIDNRGDLPFLVLEEKGEE